MDKPVQVPVENSLRVPRLVICPVVLHHLVRLQDIAADLAAEVGVLHLPTLLGELRLALLDRTLGAWGGAGH